MSKEQGTSAAPGPSSGSGPVEGETELMTRITDLCRENKAGISEKTLQIAMSGVALDLRARAINKLLGQGRLEIFKQGPQQVLLYRLRENDKLKGTDDEETTIVYSIIKESGNKGIWSRDLRFKSNLNMTLLNKVLKNMERERLIKSVKSVSASRKKVYMLFDIEPDRSVTGGSWYSNELFDSEFVDVLNQQCSRFLQEKAEKAKDCSNPILRKNGSFATSSEVAKFIEDLNISKVKLGTDDIESILDTLVFDGQVEKHVMVGNQLGSGEASAVKMYRSIEPLVKSTGYTRMPCGVCPVMHDCYEGGLISPSKCVYFKEWFDEAY